MSAQQRPPRHTPQDDDDDEEHTLLPAHDTDTDDDIDDLMKQLPDDTIRGALGRRGRHQALGTHVRGGLRGLVRGRAPPEIPQTTNTVAPLPAAERSRHHADHQHELRRRWLKATHAIDLTGEGFGTPTPRPSRTPFWSTVEVCRRRTSRCSTTKGGSEKAQRGERDLRFWAWA